MIEILTASKEHSEDAIRAGLAESRPGFSIEALELVGDEWQIRIADGNPFAKDDEDDSSDEKPKADAKDSDDSDDKKDSDSEDKSEKSDSDKGEKKDDNASVEKLRALVEELSQKVEEVVNNATEVAEEADGKQQKMEEIHDSVKEHVKGDGEGAAKGDMDDLVGPPLPEDAVGLEDIGPTPGAPKGGPKPPMPPAGPGAGPKKRPPAAPGVSAFGRAVVANHPGVDNEGNKIELLSAALQINEDPEYAELELVGMVKNRDGSFSAKLQPRNAS